MPKVTKPRHKTIDVTDDQLPSFLEAGFALAEGASAPVEDNDPGLSKAEINKELDAVEKLTRKAGKDKGLSADEIETDVAAALAEAKAVLGVE